MNEYYTRTQGEEPNPHGLASVPIDVWRQASDDELDAELVIQALGGERQPATDAWSYLSREGRAIARALRHEILSGPLGDNEVTGDFAVHSHDLRLIRSDVYYLQSFYQGWRIKAVPLSLEDVPDKYGYNEAITGLQSSDKVEIGAPHNGKTPDFYLVYTGPGLQLNGKKARARGLESSFDRIWSANNDFFQVEVDGVTYDTRLGMIKKTYSSLVYDCWARGEKPWDSIKDHLGRPITQTWLTGESLRGKSASMACIEHNRPSFWPERTDRNKWEFRFRPAVKIPIPPRLPH